MMEYWSIGKSNRYGLCVACSINSKLVTRNDHLSPVLAGCNTSTPSLQYSSIPMSNMEIEQSSLSRRLGKSL